MADTPASIHTISGLLDRLVNDPEYPVDEDLVRRLRAEGGEMRRKYAACIRHQAPGVVEIDGRLNGENVDECGCQDVEHCPFVLDVREIIRQIDPHFADWLEAGEAAHG